MEEVLENSCGPLDDALFVDQLFDGLEDLGTPPPLGAQESQGGSLTLQEAMAAFASLGEQSRAAEDQEHCQAPPQGSSALDGVPPGQIQLQNQDQDADQSQDQGAPYATCPEPIPISQMDLAGSAQPAQAVLLGPAPVPSSCTPSETNVTGLDSVHTRPPSRGLRGSSSSFTIRPSARDKKSSAMTIFHRFHRVYKRKVRASAIAPPARYPIVERYPIAVAIKEVEEDPEEDPTICDLLRRRGNKYLRQLLDDGLLAQPTHLKKDQFYIGTNGLWLVEEASLQSHA